MDLTALLNNRDIKLTGPFPDGQLVLQQMTAIEGVGRPFELRLDVLSSAVVVDYEAIMGKAMTVEVGLPQGGKRHFNGYVAELQQTGHTRSYTRYHVVLRPWLWLLANNRNTRIFQDLTALQVIEQIFREHGFPFNRQLNGTYRKWDYLVQYHESDFNFVSRLLEQEGLYYFFIHDEEKHTLVLADTPNALPPLTGYAEVPLFPETERQRRARDHLDAWGPAWQMVPGRYASKDFNFQNPKGDLYVVLEQPKGHANSQFEIYDQPGEYRARADGEEHVRKHLEAVQASHALFRGTGTARGLVAGSTFRLIDFELSGAADVTKTYFILHTTYTISNSYESGAQTSDLQVRCSLTAMDSQIPFRLPSLTPKPVVGGPQTAIVVGKAGEEIWTDQYGRVKVQFHWDREGKSNEDSSCWVRVAQLWAGSRFGAIHLPRIGQEVIVDFLEGDPDRPIITGRVYNGDNMPPYELPANRTQSGIKSRSSKGGTADNANEIRFEDKKGEEELYLQAEKDQRTLVKNDQTVTVKNDQTITVHHNRQQTVNGERTTTVVKKNTVNLHDEHQITVDKKVTEKFLAEHDLAVTGPQTISITNNKTEHVTKTYELTTDERFHLEQGATKLEFHANQVALDAAGAITIVRGPAKMSLDDAGAVVISTPTGITFQCGANKITISPTGVEISAAAVQVLAAGNSLKVMPDGVHTDGAMVTVSAKGLCTILGMAGLNLNS
jgi:type VI secretion system secreted protein VgrG